MSLLSLSTGHRLEYRYGSKTFTLCSSIRWEMPLLWHHQLHRFPGENIFRLQCPSPTYWLRLRSVTQLKKEPVFTGLQEAAILRLALGNDETRLGAGLQEKKPQSLCRCFWPAWWGRCEVRCVLTYTLIHHIFTSLYRPQHSPPPAFLYLPPCSPFLSNIEELFSAWRWKVYDRQPLGRGLWWNRCGHHSGMDEALKAILPSSSGRGRYCPWCGRGAVARPSCAVRCCLIIFLSSNISAHVNNLKNVLHFKLFQWYGKAKYRWRGFIM